MNLKLRWLWTTSRVAELNCELGLVDAMDAAVGVANFVKCGVPYRSNGFLTHSSRCSLRILTWKLGESPANLLITVYQYISVLFGWIELSLMILIHQCLSIPRSVDHVVSVEFYWILRFWKKNDLHIATVDGRNPAPPGMVLKPYEYWDIYINWWSPDFWTINSIRA